MRIHTISASMLLAACLAIGSHRAAVAAKPLQIQACPSRDKAEQLVQSNGNLSPDGCRTVTVTSVDSPAGAMCVVKFGDAKSGIVGQITSAVETTAWWMPCSNLHAP